MTEREEIINKYNEYSSQVGNHPPFVVGGEDENGYSDINFLYSVTFKLSKNQILDILKILKVGAKKMKESLLE